MLAAQGRRLKQEPDAFDVELADGSHAFVAMPPLASPGPQLRIRKLSEHLSGRRGADIKRHLARARLCGRGEGIERISIASGGQRRSWGSASRCWGSA